MFDFLKSKPKTSKKQENKNPEVNNSNQKYSDDKEYMKFYNFVQDEKKKVLGAESVTREELKKEIEKQLIKHSPKSTNPFRTNPDVYYVFYNSNMSLATPEPIPFEEITIGGNSYYINKEFVNSEINVKHIFAKPELEINLEEEYKKKETTKLNLKKINQTILLIKQKISEGQDKYKLIDIKDLIQEKLKLEKILDSIKYGKVAYFMMEHPTTQKQMYMLRYSNGDYKYMKITEQNFVTQENSVKFLKIYQIRQKVQDILNLRIKKNWKQILITIAAIIFIFCGLFGLFKLMTFEEELVDKRVKTMCYDSIQIYKEQLMSFEKLSCTSIKPDEVPFNQAK